MTTAAPAAPAGGAAPAAPSATPAPGAPGGRSPNTPPGAASPSEKGRSPVPAARANDGRFLPKDGNVGAQPGEPEQSEEVAAAKREAYRLKGKRKVYGEEVDFDLDEEAALNQLARARAMEKR